MFIKYLDTSVTIKKIDITIDTNVSIQMSYFNIVL